MIHSSNSINDAVSSASAAASSSSIISREIKSTNHSSSGIMAVCGISIDTTTDFGADIPQQDSGSNQSGSDSGLGYANSFSSDNSSITNNATTTGTATGQVGVVESLLAKGKNNNNNNGIIINSAAINTSKESNESSHIISRHDSKLAPSCIKIAQPTDANDDFVDSTFQSRLEPDRMANNRQTVFKSNDNFVAGDGSELAQPLSSELATPSSLPQQHTAPVHNPVLKSLLKKPSSHLTSDKNEPRLKHNRNVSFNQTVIVFCEEIGASSPDDEQFEPPLGYQDPKVTTATNTTTTFEPPDDYCDHKVNERKAAASSESSSLVLGAVGRDTGGFSHRGTFSSDAASNLTDEQLIGLLENDTLLETFKLNCDDFSEDDFPINHLNSTHGYLCNDAMSDYDSDSESSFCIDNKKNHATSPLSPITKTQPALSAASSDTHQSHRLRSASGSESNLARQRSERFSNYESSNNEKSQQITKSNPQKSMPARMKVSTVDNSHSKKQNNRQVDPQPDPKAKIEFCQNNSGGFEHDLHHHSSSLKTSQHEFNDTRAAPLLIKQTNLEPFSLSKSVIVSNNLTDQCPAPSLPSKNPIQESKVVSQNSLSFKPTDQIRDNHTRVRGELAPVQQNLYQSLRNGPQLPTPIVDPNTQWCHICKVIESTRPKVAAEVGNTSIKNDSSMTTKGDNVQLGSNLIESNQFQPTHSTATNQPAAVFNQSCVSCRDVSMQQQHSNLQNGLSAQPRPTSYQLVYVVDSKGNRLRALSMVRAPSGYPTSSSSVGVPAGRRVFIAHNGVRFPNPVSVAAGQIVNLPNHHHQQQQQQLPQPQPQQSHRQWDPQNSLRCNNAQHYRVVGSIQAQNPQTQQNQYNQSLNSNIKPQTHVPTIQRAVPQGKPRQHTVYYVRQPLDTQNIRQSFDSTGSNARSFPDPHEIRRLDGLRGPTSAINLSNKLDDQPTIPVGGNQGTPGEASNQVSNSTRDEMDDPTFGFSKRPSVKVVATNSNLSNTLNNRSRLDGHNNSLSHSNANQNNLVAIRSLPPGQAGNVRPVSLVVMRSQTLDRRHILQQQPQQQPMKENIPSTSSMSNIHGTYINNHLTNKVSMHSSQQPRISDGGHPSTNHTCDNLKSKDVRSCELEDIGSSESNKNVILNQGVVQQTRQNTNDLSVDRNNRRAQEQSEVAYSMNI